MEGLLKSLIITAFQLGREAERKQGHWGNGESAGKVALKAFEAAWANRHIGLPYSDDSDVMDLWKNVLAIKLRLS